MITLNRQPKSLMTPAKCINNLSAKVAGVAITSLVVSMTMTGAASAASIRTGFTTNTLSANDDLSTDLVNLGFTANFFGTSYSQAHVNNNGNLTFRSPLSTYTPTGLAGITTPIIAAFFADVDTRGLGSSPVTYGTGTVNGRNAFGANYVNVGYYPSRVNKLNDFQLLLIDRADTGTGNFDIEFNYDKVQWESGGASNGSNGLGGVSAAVGYSNGLTGANQVFYQQPGSLVNGALLDDGPAATSLIRNSLNSNGILGRYTLTARNGNVVINPPSPIPDPTAPPSIPTPDPTAAPEPFTIVGTLLGGAAAFRMKKRLKVTNKL
jgi:Nidogen-like